MVRGQRVCWFHLCPMNEAGPLVLSELEVPAAFQLCGASGRIYEAPEHNRKSTWTRGRASSQAGILDDPLFL